MTIIQKYRLSTLGVAIVAVYLCGTEVADRWEGSWDAYRSLSAKETKLANPENVVERRRQLQAEVVSLRATSASSLGEIERSENGVIAWIGQCARKTGLRIASLVPRSEGSSSTTEIQMTVGGRYHDIGRMVNMLEQGPVVIRVQKLELSKASSLSLSAKLVLRAAIGAKKEGM